MIQGQIPEWLHRTVAGLQGGVFIPSVILCFILLCYNFYHQYTGHSVKHQFGWCRKIMISIVALIAMVLCIATFVVQIVAYNILKREINNAKGELLGGLIGSLVNVNTRTGASVWMSLAAAIALLFATVLLCFTVCCMDRRKTRAAKDEYPMDRI
jgi:ABC-type Fe3+ transport system permease subunit